MNNQQKNKIFESLIESLELPDSAYEKAKSRYEDISKWLCREESRCRDNKPKIYPQGSFRLGTAIPPLGKTEEYDLDLVCNLQEGISKAIHSQQALKTLIGNEIEDYRLAAGIKEPKEEKHRCWRLNYADELSFHMDVLPCIPSDEGKQKFIFETIMKAGEEEFIAKAVAKSTVSITDDRHPRYRIICDDWHISNPEGYAQWFIFRMKQAKQYLNERVLITKAATIDELPIYRWKTPLQRCIQMLKRHRDQMFEDDQDVKPVSIIISTLAARAYRGEGDIESAMRTILTSMPELVRSNKPRVPNPVNPVEDFADRWSMPDGIKLNLEKNFWDWIKQARIDFDSFVSKDDANFIAGQAKEKFKLNINSSDLAKKVGIALTSLSITPKTQTITGQSPWCREA